jgi:DNA polymerase IV
MSDFAFSNLSFNPANSTKMHLDLNSCFATIEQQANPLLQEKPIAVAAYSGPGGCILAPSVEAKLFGVKTGMRVKDGKALCPQLMIITPDPWKYRVAHLRFRKILSDYTDDFEPRSIDEFILDFEQTKGLGIDLNKVAKEIKQRIKEEIGEWIRISVGIAPNENLAKVGAGIHKPDGLDTIDHTNYLQVYEKLDLLALPGINTRNQIRLNRVGIYTVLDFYHADSYTLKQAFGSIVGYYWYLRLRGFEIDRAEHTRKSVGNSYAIPHNATTPQELAPILQKLVEKMGSRLRKMGFKAQGIHLMLSYKRSPDQHSYQTLPEGFEYRNPNFWHKGYKLEYPLFDSRDLYRQAYGLLCQSPRQNPVHTMAVTSFNLTKQAEVQLELFDDIERKEAVVATIDRVNNSFGSFVLSPATMLNTENYVIDRIAFGGMQELEEFIEEDPEGFGQGLD